MGSMEAFAERLVDVLKMIINIDSQRQTVKVWFPGRIASVKENITGNDFGQGLESPFGMGTSENPASFDLASGGVDDLNVGPSGDLEQDNGSDEVTNEDINHVKKDRRADAFGRCFLLLLLSIANTP